MPSESLQHKLTRVRRPRVHITYDVETNGAMEKKELPFVVGVLADLSAQRAEPLPQLKERKFIPVDRDNFDDVMEKAEPRLALTVQNRLTDENTKLAVELKFQRMEDFDPARVANQIEPLRDLLEARHKLTQLLTKMEGNDKLERLLADVLTNTEKAIELARKMGIEPGAEATATGQEEPR